MTEMTITRSAYPIAWQESPRRTSAPAPQDEPVQTGPAETPRRKRRATGLVGAAMAAVIAVAAVFGPGPALITRLGAGEQISFATVSAADTIRSNAFLAEVPAAGRRTA